MIKKKYKALMLDLDGTTIPNDPKGKPSDKVRDAINLASKKMIVSAVTGRPFFSAKRVTQILSFNGPLIVSGGAQIVTPTGEVLWERKISQKDTFEICKLLKKYKMKAWIQRDGDHDTDFDASFVPEEAISITAINLTTANAELLTQALKDFPELSAHKIVGWNKGTTWVQINHAESTKQHAVVKVAELLKIQPYEIIGVGDGYNDFPLLMACGLKVAMGNAVLELKAIADYIAPTVDDDGVADVIEKFIL